MSYKYTKNFADKIFGDFAVKIKVYLRGTKTQSARHDKYHNEGYTVTNQNYYSPKAIIREVQANELILKELGLVSTQAKKIVVQDRVIPMIKLSERIVIGEYDYYVYNDAVGSKLQIVSSAFGYSTVMLFRKKD